MSATRHQHGAARGEALSPYELGQLVVLFNAGRYAELEARTRWLVKQHPDSGTAWKALGLSLQMQGKAALPALRKTTELLPDDAEAHNNLGNALKELGQFEDALLAYGRALDLNPDFAEARNNRGHALRDLGRLDEALADCRRAVELKPDFAEAHINVGLAMQQLGQYSGAVASYGKALEIRPDSAEAYSNLGNALHALGRLDDAIASCRRALAIDPDFAGAYSNLLMAMQYAAGPTLAESFAEHLAYARCFEVPLRAQRIAHRNLRDPSRRLKIGYVSPDFRAHAVAYFIEPVLAQHDPEQFEIYCYYNHSVADEVTLRLKSMVDHWRDISALSDDDVAKRIKEDGIDILVDLAGHTAGGRLRTFARKPAPVQATWLGYLCTTGLASMDYRITDVNADPVGQSERYYTETLVRLPDTFVCYRPTEQAPEVGALPALKNGHITFGSFNNLAKMTPEVRALWVQVLLAVPGSRLMLKTKGLNDAQKRRQLVEDFVQHGVVQNRLELVAWDGSYSEHLNRYNQMDIGLDPFPCNGGTTSFDAMWMGVPVVSLAGDRFISRMGVSMLTRLGLTELVASAPQEYVAIAARLASDLERLAGLRAGLRERMTNSPLTDAGRFARNLEQAYRDMWVRWCERSQDEAP